MNLIKKSRYIFRELGLLQISVYLIYACGHQLLNDSDYFHSAIQVPISCPMQMSYIPRIVTEGFILILGFY